MLVTESKSRINAKVARLPHVMEIAIGSPTENHRKHFIEWFDDQLEYDQKLSPKPWCVSCRIYPLG